MDQDVIISGLDDIQVANTPIDDLDSENINLVFIAIDGSSSMGSFAADMRASLTDFKQALMDSKEADEFLAARADFTNVVNVGGYQRMEFFPTTYNAYGMTSLYDVIVEGKEKLIDYMTELKQNGMRVKAVFAVFSDGDDTSSRNTEAAAHAALDDMNSREIVTAFISFGNIAEPVAKRVGFKNILKVGASASELRRAFNVLSKSVKENSKSVAQKTDDLFNI